jgi:hypothetical protein
MDSLIQHIKQHIGKPASCAHCNTAVHHGFGSCQHCPAVLYCGAVCQEMDWRNGHFVKCSGYDDGSESDLEKHKTIDYVDLPADIKALLMHYLEIVDLKGAIRLSEVNKAYTKVFRESIVRNYVFHLDSEAIRDPSFAQLAPYIKKIIIANMDVFEKNVPGFNPSSVTVRLEEPQNLSGLPTSVLNLDVGFAEDFKRLFKKNFILDTPSRMDSVKFRLNLKSLRGFRNCEIGHLKIRYAITKETILFQWPKSVQWLSIDTNDRMLFEEFPANLKRLEIEELEQPLENLPHGLEYLNIDQAEFNNVVFPSTLIYLRVNMAPIDAIITQWPAQLQSLFWTGSISKTAYHALPNTLVICNLAIGDTYRLDKWPPGLQEIIFNTVPDTPISNLPQGLKRLCFRIISEEQGSIIQVLNVPSGLEEVRAPAAYRDMLDFKFPPNCKFIPTDTETDWVASRFPAINY